MKKLVLSGIASVVLALGAQAQGIVTFADNNLSTYGVAITDPGNYYQGGDFTIQIWSLNSGSVPAGINDVTNTLAYADLTTLGFTLESTFQGFMDGSSSGTFDGGVATLTSLPLHATQGIVALAAWDSHAGSAALSSNLGVIAFLNPVGDPNATPTPGFPAPLSGWDNFEDLVMTPNVSVPEPGTFALAGLGAAALLIFRRRK